MVATGLWMHSQACINLLVCPHVCYVIVNTYIYDYDNPISIYTVTVLHTYYYTYVYMHDI